MHSPSDISESRLAFAKKNGANSTVLVKAGTTEQELADAVQAAMGGQRPDVTIECSGAESSIRLSILVSALGKLIRHKNMSLGLQILVTAAIMCVSEVAMP